MENYRQKINLSLTKNKNGYRYSNSSKKIIFKHYNPIKNKLLLPKWPINNKFLYRNNKFNIYNNKSSNSFGKKKNRNISHNLLDSSNNSLKKTISLNNSTKKYILKIKNKIFNNMNKDINYKKALKGKKTGISFIKGNINKNKLYKNAIKDNNSNISFDKNSFLSTNYNNYMKNTNSNINYLEQKKSKQHIMVDPYSLIYQRNIPSMFKSNTYNDLEIICEGINNNINNISTHINNININCINNKQKKTEYSPKDKNIKYKAFENKKIKKNKSTYLTSINNSNYANILNYNIFSKKKHSNKKKIKSKQNKNQNKSTNENEVKYKLEELKEKMEKLFDESESSSKKYNIIKDKFDESINIMGLNEDEKKFLKLIMNKYNDVISSYSKENKNLKKTSEKFRNLNNILDKKYSDLESKYNQNIKLLKKLEKSVNLKNEIIDIKNKDKDCYDNEKSFN